MTTEQKIIKAKVGLAPVPWTVADLDLKRSRRAVSSHS